MTCLKRVLLTKLKRRLKRGNFLFPICFEEREKICYMNLTYENSKHV